MEPGTLLLEREPTRHCIITIGTDIQILLLGSRILGLQQELLSKSCVIFKNIQHLIVKNVVKIMIIKLHFSDA